jgi:cytochrome c
MKIAPRVSAMLAAMLAMAAPHCLGVTFAQYEQAEAMRHLAGELGCTVCHRDVSLASADPATPIAPAWRDIAQRYRGQPGAEARLAKIVTQGADNTQRHWRDRLEFAAMQGNAQQVSPQQARVLVRWILEQ